jgi:murein DD-endopeptidase MepM/ murein hydrolase activator NlpD
MGVLRLVICLFLLFSGQGIFAQEAVHVVRRGDTVYSLARQYGVGVEEILTLNAISDPRRIREGQRLRIPQAAQGSVSAGGSVQAGASGGGAARFLEYRAVRGDSLYALARRYGTTMEAIRGASGLSADHVLKIGDRLRIPQAASEGAQAPAGGTAPRVSSGGSTGSAASSGAEALWPGRARAVSDRPGKLDGVVLWGERSESVKSLTQGVVVSAGPYRGFGRVAIVQMAGGYFYVYGGCESLSVKEGDRVAAGTELGRLGVDGVSSRPQLFLMVYRSNTPIDPAKAPRS